MRIASAIIQGRNISLNTPNNFCATYKGREINITTNHGYGKPDHPDYIRYDIVVTYLGSYEVNTWQDLFSMHEAIAYALKGACLMPNK